MQIQVKFVEFFSSVENFPLGIAIMKRVVRLSSYAVDLLRLVLVLHIASFAFLLKNGQSLVLMFAEVKKLI